MGDMIEPKGNQYCGILIETLKSGVSRMMPRNGAKEEFEEYFKDEPDENGIMRT